LLTSFWLIFSFALKLPFIGKFDAIILGSNPPFSFFLIPFLKIIKRNSKILFWSFDLYPDGIYVSQIKTSKLLAKFLNYFTSKCYERLDVLVDIGDCMKNRLKSYVLNVATQTLTPWSFVEQNVSDAIHKSTREKLFGSSNLTLMYTGTIGHAHEFDNFLALARNLRLKKASVAFCFACFGKKNEELKSLCNSSDTNITFADFVNSDKELTERLSSADIMMVSLKTYWTGISVPSKFFTSIATGKPVLFSGSKDSSISSWVNNYNLGFNITNENIDLISEALIAISNDSQLIQKIKENCIDTYNKKFSKMIICDRWSTLLYETIQAEHKII
jgi:colanic acid biosynthesis glycosyl transferase WcaI